MPGSYVVRPLAGTFYYPSGITTTTNYKIFISGNEVFNIAGNLKIDLGIGKRSQASFLIRTNTLIHFQQYERITVFDQNNNLIFAGYLSQIQEQQIGYQKSLIHTLSAIDQHFLADKRIIAEIYQEKTCGAIVVDIYRKILYGEGVRIGAIYDGLLPSPTLYPSPNLYPNGNIGAISSITFAYCTVAEALDQLVTLASSSGVPYYWMIDQSKKLFFVPYTYVVNNTIVDGTIVDQEHNPCTVLRANPKYRNREWLTGGVSQTPLQTETFVGDGQATSWTLNYQVASQPIILLSTQGGGQNLTQIVGTKGTTGSEYYWAQGDAVISQDSALPKLQSTQTLTVIYTGQFASVITTQNNPQIATQAAIDGTTGIIEAVDDDKNLTDATSAILEASQILARYSVSGTHCQFTTLVPGYNPGQLITVNLPNYALNSAQMLIESVSIIDNVDNFNPWYQVNAIQGPYDTTWVQFFSNLLKGSHPTTNVTVGSASTPPSAPTLLIKDAAIRFRLQTSGGQVAQQVLKDAAIRFKLKAQNTTSITTALTGKFTFTGTVSSTVKTTSTTTYPTFSGPSSTCSSTISTKFQTTSDQAIRFFTFGDNCNSGAGATTTGVYGGNILVYWSEIETSEGVYNWSVIDNVAQIWINAGKKFIIRVMNCGQSGWTKNCSGRSTVSSQGTPQWVFNAMSGTKSYTINGAVVPKYWDSVFISKFNAFIAALGARYDNNAHLEFVQVAIGMGGECKPDTTGSSTLPLASSNPTKLNNLKSIGFNNDVWMSFIKQTIDHYVTAFPHTKMGIQPANFFDTNTTDGFGGTKYSQADIVSYAISKGLGLQNDGISISSSSKTYTVPDPAWKAGAFISTEQRDATTGSAGTGDNFECDIQAMIAYCQTSKPIYLLTFLSDMQAHPDLVAKYGSTN